MSWISLKRNNSIWKTAYMFSRPLFIFCLLTVCSAAFALPPVYENARSLGMGGVAVSIADDEQALWCNPAGLGLQKETVLSVINPFMFQSEDFDGLNDAISSLKNDDTPASRKSNMENLMKVMGNTGSRNRSNMAYYMSKNGFGISAYYTDRELYSVENPVNPRINSRVYKDAVLSASYSRPFKEDHRFFKDRTSAWWGATMKVTSRKMTDSSYFVRDFSALTPSLIKDTDKSGAAVDFDIGALWQINNPMNPTVGIFAGNILGSEFSDDAGSMERQFGFGVSIKPLTGDEERKNRLLVAAEYWDDGSDGNFLKRLRFGSTFKVADSLNMQVGFRSGYPSCGLSFSWKDVELQAALYSEEMGRRPGDSELKCYAVGASLEF